MKSKAFKRKNINEAWSNISSDEINKIKKSSREDIENEQNEKWRKKLSNAISWIFHTHCYIGEEENKIYFRDENENIVYNKKTNTPIFQNIKIHKFNFEKFMEIINYCIHKIKPDFMSKSTYIKLSAEDKFENNDNINIFFLFETNLSERTFKRNYDDIPDMYLICQVSKNVTCKNIDLFNLGSKYDFAIVKKLILYFLLNSENGPQLSDEEQIEMSKLIFNQYETIFNDLNNNFFMNESWTNIPTEDNEDEIEQNINDKITECKFGFPLTYQEFKKRLGHPITIDEAKKIKRFDMYFCDNSNIYDFTEFAKYFTNVTSIYKAFYNCKHLQNIELPLSLKSIDEKAFLGCFNLEYIDLPNSILRIKSEAFRDCIKLKKIKLSQNLKTIEKNAFYNCENLISIKIPNSVTTIDRLAFSYCPSLTNIKWNNKNYSTQKDFFNDFEKLNSTIVNESWSNLPTQDTKNDVENELNNELKWGDLPEKIINLYLSDKFVQKFSKPFTSNFNSFNNGQDDYFLDDMHDEEIKNIYKEFLEKASNQEKLDLLDKIYTSALYSGEDLFGNIAIIIGNQISKNNPLKYKLLHMKTYPHLNDKLIKV